MQKLATPTELRTAPDWLTDFLDAAWQLPGSDGQRQPNTRIDPDVAQAIAQAITVAASSKDTAHHCVFTLDADGGRFGSVTLWGGSHTHIAIALTLAWSERRPLAICGTCGTLMLPGKGRVARYCSNNCRVAAHRSK
ncbi:hypothetical protein D1823_02315 [Ruegeria sp. AD91A]|uniref:hypothetical protein n=1 Tax=Ruegeria sp. AD91A TaxID=2293862 RepID=UPI000E490E34|nr:hypothetical protein [Ruegeria sp. AD91A]AXT25532.1 hypothetical protein D1823_02315 [Ruegeria sp. AD91A]